MKKTGYFISGYQHHTGAHPESVDRLRALEEVFLLPDLQPRLQQLTPRKAAIDEICEVHDRDYLLQVKEACDGGIHAMDPDTMISPESYEEARLASGGALSAVDALVSGDVRNAFGAVRPPGHHAERDRAMGFCLFNHVAVAARYAQKRHNLERVLIVDWDVHHGNGTQNTFYQDPSVFYFSIHQSPHYPGTGRRDQTGDGKGRGTTLNVPLAAGSGNQAYLNAFEKELVPAARSFHPDLVLISAGFDAHREDPLAGMNVTEEGFGAMTALLTRLADEHCRGRILSMLEGGYNLSTLQRSVRAHLSVLAGLKESSRGAT